MFRLRFVPEKTSIKFMRGRFAGIIVSVVLSVLSVGLMFYPGLSLGIDFKGGLMIEARTPQPADFGTLRPMLSSLGLGQVQLQEFGSPNDVLIRMERQEGGGDAQQQAVNKVREALANTVPGVEIRRVEAVEGSVSADLLHDAEIAMGLAFLAMAIYIWFRFDWQFGVGALVTLILDVTKTFGFFAITGLQFDLAAVAAILTIMGFSINDKVVVYDRVRENLRKYKSMPLRELIDLSINETLNRTINTSLTTLLATLPLALVASGPVQDFAIVLIFGILLATSSSIFIAAPILLFLGEKRLGRGPTATEVAKPAT
jgi:preprotein translocase subunit SecF